LFYGLIIARLFKYVNSLFKIILINLERKKAPRFKECNSWR